ncbi:MAG TPA: hypothetical protein VMF52_00550 [Steroidobacteraceae bacterium]|nr:hypothetical protein [Steroidobacteraceae bacterium]
MKIFLGFAFRPADEELVRWCDRLFASQLVHVFTGERLGGDALTPAVQARIDQCDVVVGLLTRRDAKADGKFTTHDWVRDEINYGRNKGKRAIAVIEEGVDVGGMYQGHEMIPLDRANPLETFLRLAETVGGWKREFGRTVKVQILPASLARRVGSTENGVSCAHRLWSQGKKGQWTEVTPVPEGGGTFVWIDGVKDDDLIQLKIEGLGRQILTSVATSQWMQIELENGGGRP